MDKKTDVSKMIKKYGKPEDYNSKGSVEVAKVVCQGCGEAIFSNAEKLDEVEYSITKRKSAYFWHSRCTGSVWNHGIV